MSCAGSLRLPVPTALSGSHGRRKNHACNVNRSTQMARDACYAPAMLRPDVVLDTVHQATAPWLRGRGLDGLLVDLDDTLLPSTGSGSTSVDLKTERWIASLLASGIAVMILSNGSRARVAELGDRLGVEAVSLAGKPFPRAFLRASRRLGVPPQRTAMLGDQLFTDVLGAKLAGMTSILVTPLSPGKLPHTRLARVFERMCLEGDDRGRSIHR